MTIQKTANGPTRPTSIATPRIARPAPFNFSVIPVDRPTVERAETLSKRIVSSVMGCVMASAAEITEQIEWMLSAIQEDDDAYSSLSEWEQTFMESVVRAKPAASKGTYIKHVSVSSTMGPGVKVDAAGYR